jgi:hypothetical protein
MVGYYKGQGRAAAVGACGRKGGSRGGAAEGVRPSPLPHLMGRAGSALTGSTGSSSSVAERPSTITSMQLAKVANSKLPYCDRGRVGVRV